ncbi:hypothetical protein D9611_001001 [Ephemerocybe angulata]|uniref:F-box domain-containing protein n=1 Tax=Ephemerocybe angulata TaxID=980116 RepID=A0A8H5BNB5_9AGAR|nr:hypothetical protein D9611_001001 [Tulosesus angulatus]
MDTPSTNECFERFRSSFAVANHHDINMAQETLKELDDLRRCLATQLAQIDEKRLAVQGVISVIRSIPLEILGEIFVVLLPFIMDHGARGELIALTLVCKRWREACFLTRRLWSGISIKSCWCRRDRASFTWMHDHQELRYEKMSAWLQRAGTVPKVVRYAASDFYCACGDGRRPCHTSLPALQKLLKEGPILDHFTLTVSATRCYRKWYASMADAAPTSSWASLKSFSLSFVENSAFTWDDFGERPHSVFTLLPAVEKLRIYLPDRDEAFVTEQVAMNTPINIPTAILNRLRELHLRWDWGGGSLFSVLRQSSLVENLTIDFNYGEPRWDDQMLMDFSKESPLRMDKVTRFSLRRAGSDILDFMCLPMLTHLDMELNVDGAESDRLSDRLAGFLHRSGIIDSLQSLRVCDLVRTSAYTNITLPNLKSLRRLTLDCNTFGYLIRSMKASRTTFLTQPFLPALEYLDLHNLERGFNLDAELPFLDERAGCSPCLITVSRVADPMVREDELQKRLLTKTRAGHFLRCIPFQEYEVDKIWDY